MIEFIEGVDATRYARLAKEASRNVMVHRGPDGSSLVCEIDGYEFHADNAWQLSSRIQERGHYGCSLWFSDVFSEPGVMFPDVRDSNPAKGGAND